MVTMKRPAGLSVFLILFAASYASGQAQGIATSQSPHGSLTIPCQNCHTAQGWKPIRAVPEFDHNQTAYPLRGMHVGVACTACHVKMVFNNVGNKCQDCHADIHKRQLGANCAQCHTVRGWGVSIQQIQDHNNRFPLTGAHAAVDCDACHKNAANSKFQTMSTNCLSCHMKEFKATTNPNHVAGGAAFQAPCEQCHSTDNWMNAKFDHSTTGFLLTGGHADPPLTCDACHKAGNFHLAGATCVSCHLDKFQSAKAPDHVAGAFPQTCEFCHNTTAWQPAKFDHSTTGFPLTGLHVSPPLPCSSCHTNSNYNITVTTCVSCHLANFTGAKNPDHVAGGFAQTCEICHNTAGWSPATFDHSKSGFPLTGAHATTACALCHTNNNYNITVTTCVSCHLDKYQSAKAPDHVAGGFPQTCETCHNTTAWQPAAFNHATTGWPLTGAHVATACALCHTNNNYNITVTTCVSCHLDKYQSAKAPDHVGGGFPQTCETCHNTAAWQPAAFNHATTGWPLTGTHLTTACALCHTNNNYNITVTTCVSCHLAAYTGAKTPVDHTGFPTTCEQCHDTVLWTDATFNHATTGWPLTGTHATTACALCHTNNNYNITVTTCISCHQTDFNGATTPVPHTGFPTTCELCHNTVHWTDATFNHNNTPFPLTGLHASVACALCHVNGNYTTLPLTCIGCHLATYNATTNPGHAAQPTFFPSAQCSTCHTITTHISSGRSLCSAWRRISRLRQTCHIRNTSCRLTLSSWLARIRSAVRRHGAMGLPR